MKSMESAVMSYPLESKPRSEDLVVIDLTEGIKATSGLYNKTTEQSEVIRSVRAKFRKMLDGEVESAAREA